MNHSEGSHTLTQTQSGMCSCYTLTTQPSICRPSPAGRQRISNANVCSRLAISRNRANCEIPAGRQAKVNAVSWECVCVCVCGCRSGSRTTAGCAPSVLACQSGLDRFNVMKWGRLCVVSQNDIFEQIGENGSRRQRRRRRRGPSLVVDSSLAPPEPSPPSLATNLRQQTWRRHCQTQLARRTPTFRWFRRMQRGQFNWMPRWALGQLKGGAGWDGWLARVGLTFKMSAGHISVGKETDLS